MSWILYVKNNIQCIKKKNKREVKHMIYSEHIFWVKGIWPLVKV